MKKLISTFAIFFLFYSSQALALTPEESIKAIVSEVKTSREVSSIAKHVDWDFAFSKLSEREKNALGFSSASSMKSYYTSQLENNGDDVITTMKKEVIEQNEQGQKYDPQNLNKVSAHLEELKIKLNKDITAMSFDVGVAKLSDSQDTAMVVVKRELNGESMTKRIRLSKSGDKWLVSSAEIFNPIKSVYTSPVGGTLNPIMAIHNL